MSRDREQKIREILFEKKLNPNNPADWEVIMSGRAPNPDSPDGKYMAVDKSGNVYFTDSPGADRVFTDEKGRTYKPSDPSTGRGGKYRPTRKYITVKTAPEEVEEEPPVVPVMVPPTPKPTPVPPSPTPKPTPKPPEDAYIDIKDPDQIITKEKLVRDPRGFNWIDAIQNAADYGAAIASFVPGRGRQIATALQTLSRGVDLAQGGANLYSGDTVGGFNQAAQFLLRGSARGANWRRGGKAYQTMAPVPFTRGKFGGGAMGQIGTVNVGGTVVPKLAVPLNPTAVPGSRSFKDPVFSARPEDLPFGLSNIFGKRAAGYQKGWQQKVASLRPQAREPAFDPMKFMPTTTAGMSLKDKTKLLAKGTIEDMFPYTLGGSVRRTVGGKTSMTSAGRGISVDVPSRLRSPIVNTQLLAIAPFLPGPERTETETTVIPGQTRRIRIPGGGGAGNAGVSPEPAASDEGGMQLYRQGSNYFVAPDNKPSPVPEPVLQYPSGGGGEPQPAFGYPDATQGRYPADPNTWEGLPTVSAQRMRMGPSRGRQYSLSMGGFGG